MNISVQQDKERWLEANKVITNALKIKNQKWQREYVMNWLKRIDDIDYREDMRRRLNVVKNNRAEAARNAVKTRKGKAKIRA